MPAKNVARSSTSVIADVVQSASQLLLQDGEDLFLGSSSDAHLTYDISDANANLLMLQLPTGGAVNVPVLAIGCATGTAIVGTDLGLFNGITQTTLAVVDADNDSYIALDFSADDAARIRAGGAATYITFSQVLHCGAGLTLDTTTTGITGSGTYTTGILLSGTMGNGVNATGTFTDHVIDIQPAASLGANKAFYVGSWGAEAQFDHGGGLFRMYGKVGAGGTASAMIFTRSLTESATPVIGAQFYTDCSATTPGPTMLSAIDCFTVLNAAGYLAAGSSWLDSMHSGWFKVQGDVTSVCNGRVVPVWIDNQMSCAVAQEEYGIIATTGGTRPDAFIGFETSSSGYDQLLYFDETFNSGAGTCVTTDAVPGTQDARIKVYYNGAQYYLALYR